MAIQQDLELEATLAVERFLALAPTLLLTLLSHRVPAIADHPNQATCRRFGIPHNGDITLSIAIRHYDVTR